MTKEEYRERIKLLPHYVGEAQSKSQIRKLPLTKPGDIFWVTMDETAYVVNAKAKGDLSFTELDMNATLSTGMTIYDLNHTIISKEPLFDFGNEEARQNLSQQLNDWFDKHIGNTFFLLYGRDCNYFTLFKKEYLPIDEICILECIANCGDLISMDFTDEAIEVWVRTETNPAELLYLFPCDTIIEKI